jgi:very-short-patch-repair endonuclease
MPHAVVSKQQRSRAKLLRNTMTRAETLLWRYVKAGRIDGLAFRRQVPMQKYIADLVCHSRRLVVELDGESHDFESTIQRDAERDAWFVSQGYTLIRFTNEQVLTNLEGVVEAIRIEASKHVTPLPVPPPQGGREPSNNDRARGEVTERDPSPSK